MSKKVSMILNLPNELNEYLLDLVAQYRKQGVKTSKEQIILEVLTKHLNK